MPWCDECDERRDEDELTEDGRCAVCGSVPASYRSQPWYVKFLVVGTVIYLAYRLFQGVTWVVHHI